MNIQVGANTGKNNKQERGYGKGEEKGGHKKGGGEDSGMKWKSWGKGVYVQGGDFEQSMGESTKGEKSYETWYTISCFNQPVN